MKLYDGGLTALLVLAVFSYTVSIAERTSAHGTVKITKAAVVNTVKGDVAKFHPSDVTVYNK